jgi:intracellular multiplication protein IcmK
MNIMNMKKKYMKALFTVTIACISMSVFMFNVALAQSASGSQASSASANNTAKNDNAALSREAMISQLLSDTKQENVSQKSKSKAQKDAQKLLGNSQTFTSIRDMNHAMFTGGQNAEESNGEAAENELTTLSPQTYNAMQSQAFSSMTRNMMPLSPTQIKQLHGMYNQSRRAASSYAGTPPKPTSSSVVVDLSPGSTPPVIRLLEGYITSLVLLDSTGEAWPITAVDVGDPHSFNVQWDHKGNTLLIQALSAYKSANLAVIVKGLTTPIMLTLLPGQTAVDYRVDVRIPRLGPNANTNMISQLPSASNVQLLSTLDGIPPAGSKALEVEGGDAQVWQVNDKLYLRTHMTLLSPSWTSTISSADGTHAYLLQTSPVLLALNHGKIVQLKLKGL